MSQNYAGVPGATAREDTRRAAIASVAGCVLEYYDFAIYGLAAALVFGQVFFPTADPTVGLLASFATFGVGFVARPLGGILFGHLGDRIGRKRVLIITVALMGTATVLIGCLPGYETLGFWAPALLVVLRLAQGLAYGGEWGGAVLIVSEHAPERRRGLYSALPNAGLSLGLIVGNVAFLAVGRLDPVALQTWGWRVPFWAGGVLVVVALLMRRGIKESPQFERNRELDRLSRAPVRDLLRTHPAQVLLAAGVLAGVSVTTYFSITYSLSFARQAGVPASVPLLGVLLGSALHLVLVPLAGALSDRFGRFPLYLIGVVVTVAMAFAFFPMLATGSTGAVVLAYLLIWGVGYGIMTGVFPALLAEAFDAQVGYSGVSIGTQLGNLVGGFTPFLATLLVAAAGTGALAGAVAAIVVLSLGCAAALARRAGPVLAQRREPAVPVMTP